MAKQQEHYFQACTFQRKRHSPVECGVAKVKWFGVSDVEFIVDLKGNKIPVDGLWSYVLDNIIRPALCLIVLERK